MDHLPKTPRSGQLRFCLIRAFISMGSSVKEINFVKLCVGKMMKLDKIPIMRISFHHYEKSLKERMTLKMKNFHKMFAAGAAALLLMAGCSSAPAADDSAKKDDAAASTNGEKTSYIIATDTAFPPFEFTDADGEFKGIDVELLDAIAEDQDFDYELNQLGFDASLLAVQSGQADGMIAGMSITDERQKTFDFSDPYYSAEVTFAVKPDSDIKSLDDLKGSKVAVKTATNGADYAKSLADEYDLEIVEFKDSPTMYQDVLTGNTAACFEDYPVMAYNIQQGAQLVIPEGVNAAGSDYGFAVKKDANPELLEKFNTGLKNIKDNGKFQEIVDSYTK